MNRCMNVFAALCVTSVLGLGSPVLAQLSVVDGEDGVLVYRLTVSPSPESTPLLKYRLTVPHEERVVGNAATLYLRSTAENGLSSPRKNATDMVGKDPFYDWAQKTPLDEIPADKLRAVSQLFDSWINNHIARATRCSECDWGLGEEALSGMDLLTFPLPSMQNTREFARVLSLRTRHAILDGRYDDAVEHLRMTYQLGRNVGKVKLLVCSLIGYVEAAMANDSMLWLIVGDDSPNMYWALSEIPMNVVDHHASLNLDLSLGLKLMDLEHAESLELSKEEWNRRLERVLSQLRHGLDNPEPEEENSVPITDLMSAIGGQTAYDAAKRRLMASGMQEQNFDGMAVGQVMLVDAAREYKKVAQELEAHSLLPWQMARKSLPVIEEAFRSEKAAQTIGRQAAMQIMPAAYATLRAKFRTQRDIALLRSIEALRMHAAEQGAFPKSLDEIENVVVPNNPATAKPFLYRREEGVAIIDLPASDDVGSPVSGSIDSKTGPKQDARYEIRLK